MIRRPPRSTLTDTLSLHDALPISVFPWCFRQYSTDCARPWRVSQEECVFPWTSWSTPTRSTRTVQSHSVRLYRRHCRSACAGPRPAQRSEEHTSELQSLMRISYAVFCLKKKTTKLHTR